MRLSSRAATLLAAAAALPLALTACSTGSTDASAPSAKQTAKDPNASLPTGTQLKKALAPASYFPAGYAVESDNTADSGDQLLTQSAKSGAKPGCTRLESTSWIQLTGYKGGVSFAQNDYTIKDKTQELAQEIDAFRGTTAKAVMKEFANVAADCATFTDTDAHAKVAVTGKATAGLGDEAYTMTLTSGAWQNGSTLVAARSGNSVVTVLSTADSDNGAASAKKLTAKVLAGLKK
ncbi:hypothetical protein [Streptomyces malaysiense]|uniref:PknH-like extracellular domain-containing protein n=1 Tax=Streptomyces malaysiense TaxID=1428626 RepID=A0A1J4PWB8_9ACTN|nr:hypothetical protein [Streptomyces malaysiense]OIK24120.1 hypothetical protein VT52_029360 [Streptomyces malaysiense]